MFWGQFQSTFHLLEQRYIFITITKQQLKVREIEEDIQDIQVN